MRPQSSSTAQCRMVVTTTRAMARIALAASEKMTVCVRLFNVACQQRGKAQHEGQRGHGLRFVPQGMAHHARRHQHHQHKVEGQRVDDARCLQVVHGEGGEVGQRPSAADAAAREDAVGWLAFEPDASAQKREADRESAEHLAARSPGLQLVSEEEGEADYQDGNADFVKPVRAQRLFEREGLRWRLFWFA